MQLTDILAQMGGLQSMAKDLGISGQGGSRAMSGTTGAPGLASMLDLNGDGNPLDDILRMAGKVMR